MTNEEIYALVVAEARKSTAEDNRDHPLVAAVSVQPDDVITTAFRGEMGAGEHAEYTLLEKKLSQANLAGSTLFTSLEPCTSRNHPKIPCVQRIIDRRISRVIVGMLDPNPNILGRGISILRSAGIAVELFPVVYMAQLEELNRNFTRNHPLPPPITEMLLETLRARSLDDWYVSINSIYWNRNFQRTTSEIFTHLVEVIGTLSVLVSKKKVLDSSSVAPLIAKAVAWWLALCGHLGVSSVERLLWSKFPNACPYCRKNPHDNDECIQKKSQAKGPDWNELKELGNRSIYARPKTVTQWQQMFARIYQPAATEDFPPTFAKLTEEMGELAESIRVFPSEPGYFLSEAADVFAWIMKLNNLIERTTNRDERGQLFLEELAQTYPFRCRDCNSAICSCPPILASTIGRIAHEVPENFVSYEQDGIYLTAEKRSAKFGPS